MGFEDDLRRAEEHVAEARRLVHRQNLIIRLRAAGSSTWDAQRILRLLESNLRRFEDNTETVSEETSKSDLLAFLRRINRPRRVIRCAGPIACASYLLSNFGYAG